MQTRQKSRRSVDVPARYFTGVGEPVAVMLRDISEGGCRFPAGNAKLRAGMPLQISVAGTAPLSAKVRWAEDGEIGVNFDRPLAPEMVEQFKSFQFANPPSAAKPSEFAPMPAPIDLSNAPPRRFC
jgi:hypothetical protein